MKKRLLFAAAIILCFTAFGKKLPFQGKLIESGTPVNGTRTIEFSISEIGWSESHIDVPITDGLYFVVLGSKNSLPSSLLKESVEYKLSITVNGNSLLPATLSDPYETTNKEREVSVIDKESSNVVSSKNSINSINKSVSINYGSTPPAFIKISLLDIRTGVILSETETDEKGYFIFPNLPNQNFYFVVFTLEINMEPVLLKFESDNSNKVVEISGKLGTERMSASANLVDICNSGNPNYFIWYLDNDGDGFGNSNISVENCKQTKGYVLNDLDCNDNDADINPNILEDFPGSGIDANCDGFFLWYEDNDGDGFGSELTISSMNSTPEVGESYNPLDCDDTKSENREFPPL